MSGGCSDSTKLPLLVAAMFRLTADHSGAICWRKKAFTPSEVPVV